MRRLEEGFTLIEAMAMLVIIAVVSLITVPIVNNIINESKKESFAVNAKLILKQALNEKTKDENFDLSQVTPENIFDLLAVTGTDYESISFEEYNDRIFINVAGLNKWDGLSVCGAYDSLTVIEGECELDIEAPKIIFIPDGSSTYIKSSYVQLEVEDQFLDEESLRYVWTNSEKLPNEAEYVNTFAVSDYITMPSDSGSFYLHATAKDTLSNVAQEYRQFLLDNEPPIITIIGELNVTIKRGSTYLDLGATATDNIDNDVELTITGGVNPNILGTYTITYTAKDDAGNEATASRIINVIDAEAPVITIIGNNPTNIFVDSTYVDAGATAIDDIDGDVTAKIIKTGSVNTSIPGVYTINYTVSDKIGNTSSSTRTVNVIDNVQPIVVFEPNGNNTYAQNHSAKVTISDQHTGVDGGSLRYLWSTSTDIPSEASIKNSFNNGSTLTTPTNVTGTYYLWILAKDNAGNPVIVRSNGFRLDNTKPVITLKGSNPTNIYVGKTYNDAGVNTTDEHSGINNSVAITGTVNTSVPGNYTITYNVSDKAGNVADAVTRTVNVIDNVGPTVTFGTNGNNTYAKSHSTKVTVSDAHSSVDANNLKYLWNTSASAPTASSFSTKFTNGATLTTPANVAGTYYLWILAQDTAGNTIIVGSKGFKVDQIKPTLTLKGSNPTDIYVGKTYNDAGVNTTDEHSGINGSVTITGTVNTSVPGTYTLTYNVSDKAGNAANAVIRTIKVIDNVKPTVSFGTNGNSTYATSRNTKVTVSDSHSSVNTGSLKYLWNTSTSTPTESSFTTSFTNGGTINTPSNVTGGYYLWILGKDSAGNTTIARSNVFNLDNTKPVITITGSITVNINAGSAYSDAGATATDAHSGINGSVTATGTVNASIPGTYTITYNVSDKAGNTANAVTRTIIVKDSKAPVITILGNNPTNINVGSTYIDAGATAYDDVDGDITSRVITSVAINPSIPGYYYATYRVEDTAGNISSASRTIKVIDNVKPTVSFGTNGNSTYAKSRSTKVTVRDSHSSVDTGSLKYLWNTSTSTPTESSFTTSFTNGGTINTPSNVTGGYYLWILGKDSAGNTTIARSNVFNLDNTKPTVTFGTNGNSTYAKSRSTKVTVGDNHSSVNTGSLKYLWNTSTSTPTESSFTTSFTNGGTLSTPSNVTGGYYLWILAKDNVGNTVTVRSNVFNLDNTKPVITLRGSTPIDISIGSTYADAGATATDAHSGINGSVTITGTVNTNVVGTYTLTYNVSDKAGNTANAVTRTVNVTSYYQYRSRTISTTESCQTCTGSCSTCTRNCKTCYQSCFDGYDYQDASWCGNGLCCPSGWDHYMIGACRRARYTSCNPYQCCETYECNCSTYSCNCTTSTTYGSWSVWSTTPKTPSSTLEVQKRLCLNANCSVNEMPPNYGTSIQSNYTAIYSKTGLIPTSGGTHTYNYGNYGNVYDAQNKVGSKTALLTVQVTTGTYAYVLLGTNTYTFTRTTNTNRWMVVHVRGSGGTTSANIGQFKLVFNNGVRYTLNEAVTNGYIEPLVLIGSAVSSNSSYAWHNIFNIYNGGDSGSANYAQAIIIFKIKNIPMTGVSMYSSQNFSRNYDGIQVYESNGTGELSITSMN